MQLTLRIMNSRLYLNSISNSLYKLILKTRYQFSVLFFKLAKFEPTKKIMIECKVGHIEIFVKEPKISLEFYTSILGFELVEIQQEKFIWLSSGNYTLLLSW